MTYIYRVKDWPKHFENHRTRDMEYVRWLMVPNKQHGMGFTRIMAQIDGRSIFGVWYLIIEACSQQKAPRMGWLTDDGRADGRPWTIEDMAERWRTTTDEIARALDVLCAERVGWIETVENSEQSRSDDESVENSDSEKSLDVNGVYGVDLEQSAGETRGKRGVNAKERSGVERSGAEGGAGEPRSDAPAAAAGDDQKGKNREAVRVALARLRWMCTPGAVEDWTNFFQDAGCKTIEECLDCLYWVKRQARKDGLRIKWARNADGYEVMWKNRPRLVEKTA